MQSILIALPRFIVGVAGIPIGFTCLRGAYENGCDFAGFWGGSAFASIVIACWFIPAIARTTTTAVSIAAWVAMIFGTGWVLMNAVGFAAKHRTANVSTQKNAIEAYDRAVEDRARLEAELLRMKINPKKPGEDHPRWTSTAGCSNATVVESTDYCTQVRRVRDELAAARETLTHPRPLSADPMADSLRKLIDMSAADINEWWPIWAALISEGLATVCMTLAFAPVWRPPVAIAAPQAPEADPAIEMRPPWLTASPAPCLPFSKPFGGRIDGRKMRHWHKNPDLNDNKEVA